MSSRLNRTPHLAIAAVVMFLLFDFTALALNFWLSWKIEKQAVAINLAGRQRMLSQRMTKALFQIENARINNLDPTPYLNELRLTQQIFDDTLNGFAHGHLTRSGDNLPIFLDAASELRAIAVIGKAIKIWLPYRQRIEAVTSDNQPDLPAYLRPALAYATQHDLELLELMNTLTTELEQLTQHQAARIRWFQSAAFILALLNFFGAFLWYLHRMHVVSRSHSLLDNIIDKVSTCVLLIDSNNHILKSNQMAEHLFGYPHGGLLGRHLDEILRQEKNGDQYGIHADGSTFLASREQNGVVMDGNDVSIITITDITQRRRAEQYLSTLAYHDMLTEVAPENWTAS